MITITDRLRCAARELTDRRRVYARLVANGKMTAALANRAPVLRTAIVDDYQQLVASDPPDLFAARAGA
jgi:hypothetical protein